MVLSPDNRRSGVRSFFHQPFHRRICRVGFAAIFDGLNDELLRLGMLSPEMYVDASLVKANVSGYDLAPSGMCVAEFKERAIGENGLFLLTEITVDDDDVEHEEIGYFQSPEGRIPLNAVCEGRREGSVEKADVEANFSGVLGYNAGTVHSCRGR